MKHIFDHSSDFTSSNECSDATRIEKCEELTEKYLKYCSTHCLTSLSVFCGFLGQLFTFFNSDRIFEFN
jgi:hypothetical protein